MATQLDILVYPKLISRLPKPFQLVKGQRQDETPAHTALREAFVNSLIHTDYSAPGSIIVESKPESFSFTNPGTLLVTLPQFYKGGISQCRNTNLQKMFLMIGSAEKAGSGVSKILSGWMSAHWRRPYVSIDTDPDRVVLDMPMFSTIPEHTLTELIDLFGEEVKTLGKDALTALSVCHIEGDVTNSKLQYNINLHKSDITKLLQDLCKSGHLISENKSRWTTYRLNPDFRNAHHLSNMDTSNVDTQLILRDKSPIQQLIIKECQNEYISIEEIAIRVNRSEKYLKNKIIPEMIKNDFLIKMYPQINHPQQKYISKK